MLIKFHHLYRKNRLEWDDPSNSVIYFIPVERVNNDSIRGYRYVKAENKGFLHTSLISIDAPFFLSIYTPIEHSSLLILDEIRKSLDEQINDAKKSVLKIVSFNLEFSPYLSQLKKNEEQK